MSQGHGTPIRGLMSAKSSPLFQGRFGRLFRSLAPAKFGVTEDENVANLTKLGQAMSVTGHTVFPRRCPLFPLPHFRILFLCDRPAVLREHASGIGYLSV